MKNYTIYRDEKCNQDEFAVLITDGPMDKRHVLKLGNASFLEAAEDVAQNARRAGHTAVIMDEVPRQHFKKEEFE